MKIINKKKQYRFHLKNILLANNCRKVLIKIGVYLIFLSIAILIALIPNFVRSGRDEDLERGRYTTDLNYILFWRHHKRSKRNIRRTMEFSQGQSEFIAQNCPHVNCYITYNKSLLRTEEEYDAIVFNIHDVKKLNTFNINLGRSPHQIYILKSHDSSEHHPICNPLYEDFFNWTWTYKLDSDIPHPFINIHDRNYSLFGPSKSLPWKKNLEHSLEYDLKVLTKEKAIAWLVPNCKLKKKHYDFVKDLEDELKGYNYSIDLYGPCTEQKCVRGLADCHRMIEKKYFFSLVLEDSIGEDYVTEKMVKAMTYLTVPIVNGQSDYNNFLPPASFINARSFNLKKFGAVVDFLMKNPNKYTYFYDWKNYYNYTTRPRNYICDLCTKLKERNRSQSYTHKNLRLWWNPDFEDICGRAKMYTMFIEP